MRRFLQRASDFGIDLVSGLAATLFFIIAVVAGVACIVGAVAFILAFAVGGAVLAALALLAAISLVLSFRCFDV